MEHSRFRRVKAERWATRAPLPNTAAKAAVAPKERREVQVMAAVRGLRALELGKAAALAQVAEELRGTVPVRVGALEVAPVPAPPGLAPVKEAGAVPVVVARAADREAD